PVSGIRGADERKSRGRIYQFRPMSQGIFQRSDGQVGLDWDLVQFLDERRQSDAPAASGSPARGARAFRPVPRCTGSPADEMGLGAPALPPVSELAEHVKTAEAANIDETGWRENGRKAWLWVVVTSVGIVFRIVRSRAGAVAQDLLGERPKPIVISDRFPAYEWIELKSRQICWAHL